MDRKIIKQQYKELESVAGIYQIKNNKNQKVWVDSSMNLKTINGKRFSLNMGSHMNRGLQEDWKLFGEEAFDIEVLEILKKNENPYVDPKDELRDLEKKWLDHLQPYGERGYNRK